MAQNREAPSFQEYAASMLAKAAFRSMTAEAKGICWQMRMECWVNKTVPADPARLARYLGEEKTLVERVLPEVMPFFSSDGDWIRSPELDAYQAHIDEIRAKQIAGGKNGAAKTNGKNKSSETIADKGFQGDSGNPAGKSRVEPRVSSTVQSSTVQSSQTQSLKKGIVLVDDPFVSAYEQTESSYEKASNGY
jgi:uncharacterized protein YdaU (DUF1376 family)